jgi:hypothetical protein
LRINDEKIGTLMKTISWANLDAVSMFALDTRFGYNIGHGHSFAEIEERKWKPYCVILDSLAKEINSQRYADKA